MGETGLLLTDLAQQAMMELVGTGCRVVDANLKLLVFVEGEALERAGLLGKAPFEKV